MPGAALRQAATRAAAPRAHRDGPLGRERLAKARQLGLVRGRAAALQEAAVVPEHALAWVPAAPNSAPSHATLARAPPGEPVQTMSRMLPGMLNSSLYDCAHGDAQEEGAAARPVSSRKRSLANTIGWSGSAGSDSTKLCASRISGCCRLTGRSGAATGPDSRCPTASSSCPVRARAGFAAARSVLRKPARSCRLVQPDSEGRSGSGEEGPQAGTRALQPRRRARAAGRAPLCCAACQRASSWRRRHFSAAAGSATPSHASRTYAPSPARPAALGAGKRAARSRAQRVAQAQRWARASPHRPPPPWPGQALAR